MGNRSSLEVMVKQYWRYKKVFVTGCTGLMGSWLTKRLVEEGASVVGLIRDWVPESNLILNGTIQNVTTVRGEIEDAALLSRILHEYEIETVFHLAAQTIDEALSNGDTSRAQLKIYEKRTHDIMWGSMRRSYLMQRGLIRFPGVIDFLISKAQTNRGLIETFLDKL